MKRKLLLQMCTIVMTYPLIFANTADKATWLDIPTHYNKQQPSSSYPNSSLVTVTCFVSPMAMTSVSIQSMDFGLESWFIIQWEDNRFKTPKSITAELPLSMYNKLWIPPLRISNCKICEPLILDDEKHQISVIGNPKSVQFYTMYRQTFQLICAFNLVLYPFDTHECSIDFQMHDYGKRVVLEIRKIGIQHLIIPPEFTLVSQYPTNCTTPPLLLQTGRRLSNACGKYVFRLRRKIFSFIILTYIPSMLIVMVSWVSFWLDPDASAPRVALGLTSLLTLATEFSSAQNKLPPVAYVKAIDIWMFCCILIVFASLAEFIIATVFKRKKKQGQVAPPVAVNGYTFNKSYLPIRPRQINHQRQKRGCCKGGCLRICNSISRREIDSASRVLFPLIFLLFNIIYWSYYLSKYTNKDS